MSRQKTCWSELPPELLSIIALRLKLRSDVINFRSVCQSWRNSAPLSLFPNKIPILSPILPHKFQLDPKRAVPRILRRKPLVLVATSVFLARSVDNPSLLPWLFSVEEVNTGKLRLRKPLRRSVCGENFPNNLSLSRFQVSEISRLFTLCFAVSPADSSSSDSSSSDSSSLDLFLDSSSSDSSSESSSESSHSKSYFESLSAVSAMDCLLLSLWESSSDDLSWDYARMRKKRNRYPDIVSKVILDVDSKDDSARRIDDCSFMLLTYDGSLAKISPKDGEFTPLCCGNINKYDDVVSFKGRFCVIDRKGRLYWEENGELGRLVGKGLRCNAKKYLVVEPSCGELYLVYKDLGHGRVTFKVYKLNEEKQKWDKLKGIGDDRILILTQDGCFFVPAKDIPTWGGNCLVYHTSNHFENSIASRGAKGRKLKILVFDFGSGNCRPISDGSAQVLWPPPA